MVKKKIFVCLVLMLCMFASSNVFALTKLHETSESKIINSGTNLTKYKRFTDKGWLGINVIEVDLNDKNTSIGVLIPSTGLQTLQNIKSMASQNKNCIAAINGDFFTGKTRKGSTIGMTIKDGEVITSTYYENELKDVLASFVLNEDDEVIFDYFTNKMALTNLKNDEAILVSEINKWSSNYEFPVLYTREWGEYSLGSTPELVLTELVVEDGKVVDVRYNEEPTEIPENGFVICTLGNVGEVIQKSFKKGNKVKLNIDMDLDIEKVKVAVSGGTLLVKDGEVANFTHNIVGSNPRTAIGLSEDGKKLYLITIDGRQVSSIGVTQKDFAEILIEKGIYTAMNLDGGGSTTMIARELGDEIVSVENSPSDGSLRSVPNAIAVFNTEKTGSLDSLLIEVDSVNVFVGCEKELVVKGYDKYYNPVKIDNGEIKWSYSGVGVSIKDNILTAGNTAGTAIVTASIGKAKAKINIDVLSKPNELTITPKKITIGKGESVTFKVSGQNKNGYYADLKNNEVEWNVESSEDGASKNEIELENGVFKTSKAGDYIISVTAGNAISYALVTVESDIISEENNFEKQNFYFKAYPEEVLGNVEISDEEVHTGKLAAKLEYDFTKTTKTRAAYLRFDESIVLNKDAQKINLFVYATNSTSDQIKAKITDSEGNVQYLLFSKGIESIGWQELNLDLSGISLPAKLTDIYVAQDNANEMTSGTIYFDDLTVSYKSTIEKSTIALPLDKKGMDELNVYSELTGSNSFRVVVAPEMIDGILLNYLKNKKLEDIINKNSEIVVLPSQNNMNLLANISGEKVTPNGYSSRNYKGSTIISLDISDGGLRVTDSNQWITLQSDIKNAGKNVLIVMNGNLNDFKDEAEKQLFIDVLCDLRRSTGKNIWVIQKGDNTDYSMKRGIKYLSIATDDFSNPGIESIQNSNYIIITVNENKMTYEIKNVFE